MEVLSYMIREGVTLRGLIAPDRSKISRCLSYIQTSKPFFLNFSRNPVLLGIFVNLSLIARVIALTSVVKRGDRTYVAYCIHSKTFLRTCIGQSAESVLK